MSSRSCIFKYVYTCICLEILVYIRKMFSKRILYTCDNGITQYLFFYYNVYV